MDFSKLTLREKVAQTVVCLHTGKDSPFVNEPIGGVFMGAQVITEVKDDDGIAVMRENAERYLKNSKIPPLFFSDFECGCGGYIKGLTNLPLLMGLGAANDEQMAYDYGKATALEGTCAGITAAFTPVCDINYNFRNPLVNVRSVSDDPDRMLPLVKNIIKGMQDNGLAATAKHFPGDGVDWRDQHIITTENSMDMDKWWETYGRVYKELIAEGVEMVMPGHITLPAYQKERKNGFPLPATLSRELLTDLLKGELGFKGVVVSDAAMMGGFNGYYENQTKTQVECFKAGCDIVLWPTNEYIDAVTAAIESGEIPMSRLEDALIRIGNLKDKYCIKLNNLPSLTAEKTEFARQTAERIAEASITLVKNKVDLLPLKKPIKKVLLVSLCNHNAGLEAVTAMESSLKARGVEVVHYKQARPSDEEFDKHASDSDLILYALYTRSFRPVGPIDIWDDKCWAIAKSHFHSLEKSVYVSFGSPYFANQYFERANTYVNAYSMMPVAVEAFVKAMFGEIGFNYDSPVKLELPKPNLF